MRWSGWGRAGEVYAAGLFLLYAVVMLSRPQPLELTDYANWTYQGVLLARHLRGVPDGAHWLKTYPVPNSAATVMVGLLALVLPWAVAAKAWLCAQLAISFGCMRHILRTTQAGPVVWFLLPQAVFLNVNFWYGFQNFQLGLCWILLVASMLLRRVEKPQKDWPLGVVLVLAFLTHMIPFAVCGLLVLLYARQTGRWRVLLQTLPAGVLTAWYVAGRFLIAGNADGDAGMAATVRLYTPAFWAFKVNSYLKSFGFADPGFELTHLVSAPVFVGLFVLNALVALLLGMAMVQTAVKAWRGQAAERFLWTGVALLLPVFLLAPGTALGVSDPGARLLQAVLVLGLAMVAGRWRAVVPLCAGLLQVLVVLGVILFVRGQVAAASGSVLPRALAGFAHVPNEDQDFFYWALDRGDFTMPVFPTGMWLNCAPAAVTSGPCRSTHRPER